MVGKSHGLPLPLNGLLSGKYLEMHEACFILTKWPKNMIGVAILRRFYEEYDRGIIYAVDQKLCHKMLDKEVKKMLTQMKIAIKNRELVGYPVLLGIEKKYGEISSYFIKVLDVIRWAILHDYYLPEEVQNKYELYQQPKCQTLKSNPTTVKNKFLGHLIHKMNPELSLDEIRDHFLMKKFGTPSLDKTRRAIHRDLLDVFQIKEGKKGSKTYITHPLKPIQEVVIRDTDGKNRYSFALLKVIIIIATKVKIEILGLKKVMKLREGELAERVCVDLLSLYLHEANKSVRYLSVSIFLEEMKQHYSHYKIQEIQGDLRTNMTIGRLYEKNWDYCFEMFTEEEKRTHKICKPTF